MLYKEACYKNTTLHWQRNLIKIKEQENETAPLERMTPHCDNRKLRKLHFLSFVQITWA